MYLLKKKVKKNYYTNCVFHTNIYEVHLLCDDVCISLISQTNKPKSDHSNAKPNYNINYWLHNRFVVQTTHFPIVLP